MDKSRLEHFKTYYGSLPAEDLQALYRNVNDLEEEAAAALLELVGQKPTLVSVLKPTPKARRNWKLITIQLILVAVATVISEALAEIAPRWLSLLIILGFALGWVWWKPTKQPTKGKLS